MVMLLLLSLLSGQAPRRVIRPGQAPDPAQVARGTESCERIIRAYGSAREARQLDLQTVYVRAVLPGSYWVSPSVVLFFIYALLDVFIQRVPPV